MKLLKVKLNAKIGREITQAKIVLLTGYIGHYLKKNEL